MLCRFFISPACFELPEATILKVFQGIVELLGSEAAAQQLLRRCPKLFASGTQRLATNLSTLQQQNGCTLEEAGQVLLRAPQVAMYTMDSPKFQRRVECLTEWYGHASQGGPGQHTSVFSHSMR